MEMRLLPTKLNSPPLRNKIVSRKALTDNISKGIESGGRLTLVSAPAGCGKTTVVNEWVKSTERFCSWITLDEGDNDPKCFFQYLLASLEKLDNSIGKHAKSLLAGPFMPPARTVMSYIVNDLVDHNRPTVIILDDFHVIKTSYINEFLQCFLENLPDFIHLIIITREDPQLQLSKLRVRNHIVEIRAVDLGFDKDEANSFFSNVMGLKIGNSLIDKFLSKTEGWIAGLQLAGLSIRDYDEAQIEDFAKEFSGSNRYIIDYLVEEVLGHLEEPLKEFVYTTSVLDRMNTGLCREITGMDNSEIILYELEHMNLFLVPLDDNRKWYRYHHLFADSIRTGLKKEYKEELYKKASAWHEEKGFLNEAVNYSLKSGSPDEALRLIEKAAPQLFENAQQSTFLTWVDMIPHSAVVNSQGAAVKKAWALLISGRIGELKQFTAQLDNDFINNLTPLNRGLYLGLMANLVNYEENPETENMALEALELIGDSDITARIATLNTLADARKRNGKTDKALESHSMAFTAAKNLGFSFITLLALYQYGITLGIMGKRRAASVLAEDFLRDMLNEYGKPVPLMGILYALLASLYYEENRLDKAHAYALKAQKSLSEISLDWIINVDITLMNIKFAYGRPEEAEDFMNTITSLSNQANFKMFAFRNSSARTDLLLRTGRMNEAAGWESEWRLTPEDKPNATREIWYFTYVRMLMLKGNLDGAAKLTDSLQRSMAEGGRQGRLITLYILKSILNKLTGDMKNALDYMDKAVLLASSEGCFRAFLDEGIAVYELLMELSSKDNRFVDELLILFKEETQRNINGWSSYINFEKSPENLENQMIEELSERELELLRLIAEGLTNNEISRSLYISINTTQWHITNIYGKLGVKNRTQALARARELRLI